MLIAPSMLSADFLHLEKDVDLVNAEADLFHLDIMDGTFVPNISYGFPVVDAIARQAEKPLDAHLMIIHPEKYVERFAKYVKEFADRSQFLIITHRPGTMEQCDTLYGVTMQKRGISSLELMEEAGHACAEEICMSRCFGDVDNIYIYVGTGNNGGDGVVMAVHLVEDSFVNNNVYVVVCEQ